MLEDDPTRSIGNHPGNRLVIGVRRQPALGPVEAIDDDSVLGGGDQYTLGSGYRESRRRQSSWGRGSGDGTVVVVEGDRIGAGLPGRSASRPRTAVTTMTVPPAAAT